jgi:hypothetical protein
VEQEKRSLLASVPSFQVLSTEQLEMLVGALERCTYEDGEKIVNKGEVGDTFYLVQVRARWVTLRARWVTLRARWVTLRARWVTLRARWVQVRARWVTLRARWVTLRALAG